MVLRALAIALLASGWLLPNLAHGLAIGDIKTRSALNQPFVGEVLLTDVGDLSADEIRVDLATQEQFQQMGVEKTQLLNQLHFQVLKRNDGTSVIRITTEQPVTEPDLDFVLRVSWPGNTSMREFVALLDLPSNNAATAAAQDSVAPPVVQSPRPAASTAVEPPASTAVQDQSMASAPVAPAPAVRHPEKSTATPDHYRTHAGETLWSVASKTRPSTQLTVPQTMLAIQKANPAAFPGGNVNDMVTGKTLKIPSANEIRRMGAREAAQAVAEQDQAWHQHQGAAGNTPLAAAQVNASGRQAVEEVPVAANGGEVHLLAPGRAAAHKLAAASSAKIQENNQLAAALMKENALLKAQLDSDQQQIKQQQQLLALEDQKLAELEAAIKQVKQMAAAQPVAAAAHPVAAPVATPPMPEAPKPAKPATPPTPPTPAAASTASSAPNLLLWGGLGLGGLAALVGGLIAYRRYRDGYETQELNSLDQRYHGPGDLGGPLSTADIDIDALPDTNDLSHLSSLFAPQPEAEPDLWEEAGGYFQKGRFPQAAGLLHKILKTDPDRVDARLRLMQCQAEMGDSESFADNETLLRNTGDAEVMAKVEALRQKYPRLRPTEVHGSEDSLEAMEYDFSRSLTQTQMPRIDPETPEVELPEAGSTLQNLDGDVELPPLDLDFADSMFDAPAAPPPAPVQARAAAPQDNAVDFAHSIDFKSPVAEAPTPTPVEVKSESRSESRSPVVDEHADLEMPELDDLDLGDFSVEHMDHLLAAEPATADVTTPEPLADDLDFSLDELEQELVRSGLSSTETEAATNDLSEVGLPDVGLPETGLPEEKLPEGSVSDQAATAPESSLDFGELDDSMLADWPETETEGLAEEELSAKDELSAALPELPDLDELPELEVQPAETPDADAVEFDAGAMDQLSAELSTPAPEVAEVMPEDRADFDPFAEPMPELPEDFDLSLPLEEAPAAEVPAALATEDVSDMDLGNDFDFLADTDENATKLDLAKAYMDMGDMEGAKDILQEVLQEGSQEQQEEAKGLLSQAG